MSRKRAGNIAVYSRNNSNKPKIGTSDEYNGLDGRRSVYGNQPISPVSPDNDLLLEALMARAHAVTED